MFGIRILKFVFDFLFKSVKWPTSHFRLETELLYPQPLSDKSVDSHSNNRPLDDLNLNQTKPVCLVGPTPPLSRNHASIHSLKLNSKSQIPPRKPRLVKTVTPSPAPINSVKLLPKTRSQSVQPLASIQRKTSERLHCECDSCEDIRHAKLYVSREKLPKSASEKFADPLEDTTEAFINRIKVLKQYDLETARQEQTEVKRKKKKKT
jgi:hypothetical protein